MASVEKRYNKAGNLISFRIHVFHGRDEFGKQLPPFIKTVRVPPELNARQIETLIQRETVHFEEECELIIAREKEEAAKAAEPKCISFEDFAAKVMEIKERTGKEKSTLARYQDMLDSRINPYLGKTPVDEITGDMLDDCCSSRGRTRKPAADFPAKRCWNITMLSPPLWNTPSASI